MNRQIQNQASKNDMTTNPEEDVENTKNFFFALRGKTEAERADKLRLRNLKILHKPMDYEKLRKHEVKFVSEMLQRKDERRKLMNDQLKKLEKSYKISYKSKVHDEMSKDYINTRHKTKVQSKEITKNRNISKEYGTKIRKMNADENIFKHLADRFPMGPTKGHKAWFYGRFGEQEWRHDTNTKRNDTIQKERKKVTPPYLTTIKFFYRSEMIILTLARNRSRAKTPMMASPLARTSNEI